MDLNYQYVLVSYDDNSNPIIYSYNVLSKTFVTGDSLPIEVKDGQVVVKEMATHLYELVDAKSTQKVSYTFRYNDA